MLFPCVAAVAAAATHSPAWFLSGAYHPPVPGKGSNEGLHNVIGMDYGDKNREISGEALTVALDVVQAWAVLLTLGFTLIIFFFLAFCVCSKKDDGYDEFEISQGITTVKICHDGGENGVSLIPRINGSGTDSLKATDETSEASSRYTLKRELPAIPVNNSGNESDLRGKVERPVSQHSSDLYASVNDSAQGSSSFKLIGGVQVLPAGAIAPGGRAAVVKESVSSPDEAKGEREILPKEASKTKEDHFNQLKKSHPYAQVSKAEHPYAKVATRKGQDTETDTDSYEDPKAISKDIRKSEGRFQSASRPLETGPQEKHLPLSSHLGSDNSSKVETSASKVPSPHSPHLTTSVHSTISSHSVSGRSPTSPHYPSATHPHPEAPAPIPAAMAISGRTPANEEMPYMTPPVLQPTREQTQQHFSGDSQDSRGYTSISVREPLAALKARQAAEGAIAALGRTSAGKGAAHMQGSEGEGYYMTVSDDSADEMYACIYEGTRGTGSETYAQIEPRTAPSSQAPPSLPSAFNIPPASPTGLSSRTPQDPSPPAPPSVDSLRHVVHSRQASASSSASTGMGSPVAEKRGTRSPLPPLPQGDTVLYSPPEPPIISSQPVPKSPPKSMAHVTEKPSQRSLEEMYAKVLKKPPGHSRVSSSSGAVEGGGDAPGPVSSSRRGSADVGGGRWTCPSPPSAKQDMSHSLVETRTHDAVSGVNRAKSCEVSAASWSTALGGGEGQRKASPTMGNYETIPSLYSGSDPGYETVRNGEPPYASVDPAQNYPGYETVRGSDVESEPGYETLKHTREMEPGYETVLEVAAKKASPPSEPGYESVSTGDEPGYETVAEQQQKSFDPGYESVLGKGKMEYDTGYEELSHPVHGRTCSEADPNYEQLKFSSRRSSGEADSGYEIVRKSVVESNYELVSDFDPNGGASEVIKPDLLQGVLPPAMPLYASVKKKESPKTEKVEEPAFNAPKTNDNFNIIDISPSAEDSVVETLSKQDPSVPLDAAEKPRNLMTEDEPAAEPEKTLIDVEDVRKEVVAESVVAVAEERESEGAAASQRYQVTDSPEEVELPPPGEEESHRVSPPALAQELQSLQDELRLAETKGAQGEEQVPAVALTFTEASPLEGSPETSSAKSSDSSTASSSKDPPPTKEQEDDSVPAVVAAPPPPPPPSQFDDPEVEEKEPSPPLVPLDDPLPPPPLPLLDDDTVTASPPPPPPPILDEICSLQDLPPPPHSKEEVVNGLLPSSPPLSREDSAAKEEGENFPSCSPAPFDLPPPPLPSADDLKEEDKQVDNETSSKAGCVNGNMNVTVNPMAEMEDNDHNQLLASPPPPQLPPPATESPPPLPPAMPSTPMVAAGESGESQSSGSTVNGNGSVESVVTVDPKSGSAPSTSVPPVAPAPPAVGASIEHSTSISSDGSSSSSSSSGSKPGVDLNEGITPV